MRIALIAHDGKKPEMVRFAIAHRQYLLESELVTTGTTGRHLQSTGLNVVRLLSGPMGGDAQIAAMVAEKKVDLVFFFRDPMDKHPHEPDVQMLMRLCDVHNIPLATNIASAELMLRGKQSEDEGGTS